MEVSALVQQMHENLSAIHETISGLTTESHNALLTELEQKREALLEELRATFDKEQEEVNSKRQQEVDEINEKRRIEDEEREARRKQEDEDLQSKNDVFDLERHEKLDGDIKQIDEDTDKQMDEVEAAARKVIEDARLKLSELEEKRKEINRLIDEQLQLPLPEVPTRKRARAEKSGDAAQSSEEPASDEVADAEAADAEPESAEPETAEPESAEPETAEPESVEPEKVEPESAEPESLELVKAQEPVDATSNGEEQPGEATGEPASMPDQSVVEEQTDNNDKALESETPPSSEETDLPKEGGEDDADTQQQDGEEENPGELQLRSLQVADSGVGLDPEVEAGKSQPASPSGSEFRDVTGDGSAKENESIANDMAGSPNGEQEEAVESTNHLEPEAAVDANEDLNTSQPDPVTSCENQTILSEPAPESTSSNSADEGPVEDTSPSPEEDIPIAPKSPVDISQETTAIDVANAQPDESVPTQLDLEVSDANATGQAATDEPEDSNLSNVSKQLDAEEQGDEGSKEELTQPVMEDSEPVTIKDLDASPLERSIPTDEDQLEDANQADFIQPVMESSESVETEQPGVVQHEDSVQADEDDSTATEPPIAEVQEGAPVEQTESAATKSISPPNSRPTTPVQTAGEEEVEPSPSSASETAQSSDALVSDPQECEQGTDDSELPDEISGEPKERVSDSESVPVEKSLDVTAATEISELDQTSSDAAKLEVQPDLHADSQDETSGAVGQQRDSSISQAPEVEELVIKESQDGTSDFTPQQTPNEEEVAAEEPQVSISDSPPQVEPVEESSVAQNESDAVESDAQPDSQSDLQEVAADATADHPNDSNVSKSLNEEEVAAEEPQDSISDFTPQTEPVEESPAIAQTKSDAVESDAQPDIQEVTGDAVVDQPNDSTVSQSPNEEEVVAEEPQDSISDSPPQIDPVEENPVVAQNESDAVESDAQPDSQSNVQDVTADSIVDQPNDLTVSTPPSEEEVAAEELQDSISDSPPQVDPVEENPVVAQNESDAVESDAQPDVQEVTAVAVVDQSKESSISQTSEEVILEQPQEGITDPAPQTDPVEEDPVTTENESNAVKLDANTDTRDLSADSIEPSDESGVSPPSEAKEAVGENPQADILNSTTVDLVEETPIATQSESEEVKSDAQIVPQDDAIVDQPTESTTSQPSDIDEAIVIQSEEAAVDSTSQADLAKESPVNTQEESDAVKSDAQIDPQKASTDVIVDQPNDSIVPQVHEEEEVAAEESHKDMSDSPLHTDIVEEAPAITQIESEAAISDAQTDSHDVPTDAIVAQLHDATAPQPSQADEVIVEQSEEPTVDSTSPADLAEANPATTPNESDAVKLETQTGPQDDAIVDQPNDSTIPQPSEAEGVIARHSEEATVDSASQIDVAEEDSVVSHSHDDESASAVEASEKEIAPTTIVENDQIEGSEGPLANEEMASDRDPDTSLVQEDVPHPEVDAVEDESSVQPVDVVLDSSAIEEPQHGTADHSQLEPGPIAVSTNAENATMDHGSALDVESDSFSIDGNTSISTMPEESLVGEDEDHTHHNVNQSGSDLDLDQSIQESRVDEQVGTIPKPRSDLDTALPPNTLSDDSWQPEPSREPHQRSSSPEEQQPKGISGEEQDQEEGDSYSAERDNSVEPGRQGGPFDSTYVDEDYSLYSISNYADDSLDDGQNVLGRYRRDEHGQVAARSSAMDQPGASARSVSADESQRQLVVDEAPRQTTRSPLPVENVTVQGQEYLFDDSTASSHFSDEEDSEIIDSGFPEQRFVRDIHPAPLSAVSYDGAGWGEDTTDEMENELPANTETIQQPTPTQSQFDFANSFGIRMVKDAEQRRDNGFGIRMVPDAEQQHDLKPEPRAQTPSLTPFSYGNSQEVSPLVLQGAGPMTPNSSRGGLASSRHAPSNDPQTPTRRLERLAPELEADFDPSVFMPRDVTNVPWHARNDSEPYSMRSQSTVSSAMSSPVHSALPIDKHEPVIRDSWHLPNGNGERSRANTQLTDRSSGEDFDPFKYDSARTPAYDINSPRRSVQVHQPITEPSRNSIAGSPMFQKLRNMFEPPAASSNSSGRSSPTRSRPVSSIFHPVDRDRSSSQLRESHIPQDPSDSPRKGGFLNEHEDEVDENSALLQNPEGYSNH